MSDAVEKAVAAMDDGVLCALEAELMRDFKRGLNDGEWLIACRFEQAARFSQRFTAEAQRAQGDAKEEAS